MVTTSKLSTVVNSSICPVRKRIGSPAAAIAVAAPIMAGSGSRPVLCLTLKELAGARQRNFDTEHYKPSLVDLPLPDFTFTSERGAKITPSPLRGRNAVLDIWATWCRACVSALGGLTEFRQTHPEVELLLVATDSKIQEIRKGFRQ
jgi:thiol-disulfide isomerase/thioredoxin